MSDIESTITESLRSHADVGIGRPGLHDGAVARASALRRRRRAGRTVAAALGVAVATAGVTVIPQMVAAPYGAGQPISVGEPPAVVVVDRSRPTNLPELLDTVPASQNPALVGTDAGVLHFDVDLAAIAQTAMDFTSADGFESVITIPAGDLNASPRYEIAISHDRAKLPIAGARDAGQATTVNGRPAVIAQLPGTDESFQASPVGGWYLEWQPVDGLFAIVRVVHAGREQVFAAAAALRLDRAQRCAVPMTLATVQRPHWTLCRTGVRTAPVKGSRWARSTIEFQGATGPAIQVYIEEQSNRVAHDLSQFTPDGTINGHRVDWRPSDPRGLWVLDVGPMEVFITGATQADAVNLTKEQAVAVFAGLRVVGDLGHPTTWPARVFTQG